MNTAQMTVVEVCKEPDRILLYGDFNVVFGSRYHVIAPLDVDVEVGSSIIYEPYGFNFGWFVGLEGERGYSHIETREL